MRSDTRATTDRIIAALRSLGVGTTKQVCEAAGTYLEVRPDDCRDSRTGTAGCNHYEHNPWVDIVICDGYTHVLAISLGVGQRGYQVLRRLERDGLAIRERIDGQRDVIWRWTGPPIDDRLAELEASWEASQ